MFKKREKEKEGKQSLLNAGPYFNPSRVPPQSFGSNRNNLEGETKHIKTQSSALIGLETFTGCD